MPSSQFHSQVAEQADTASRQLVALSYSAISTNPKTVSVVSKLQFTYASISSHSWLSKQPQLVQSSILVVASLSCPELGTAQPQLVLIFFGHPFSISFKISHSAKDKIVRLKTQFFCFYRTIPASPLLQNRKLTSVQLYPRPGPLDQYACIFAKLRQSSS